MPLSGLHENLLVRAAPTATTPRANQLEEIKTYRGRLESVRDNHRAAHWAQARVYGHLLCQARGLAQLRVALVYFNVATEEETVLVETHEAAALAAFFEEQCGRFLAWAASELAHRQARDAALEALAFPHGAFRSGQRELAVAAYRTARDGGCLMAQAPTGIGKTLGTIFPLLKACPGAGLDKLFFPGGQGPGRALALEALKPSTRSLAAPVCGCWMQVRDKAWACIPTRIAMASPASPLAQGFTTACRGRARPRWRTSARTPPRQPGGRRTPGVPALPVAGTGALERRGGGRL